MSIRNRPSRKKTWLSEKWMVAFSCQDFIVFAFFLQEGKIFCVMFHFHDGRKGFKSMASREIPSVKMLKAKLSTPPSLGGGNEPRKKYMVNH